MTARALYIFNWAIAAFLAALALFFSVLLLGEGVLPALGEVRLPKPNTILSTIYISFLFSVIIYK